MVNIIEGKVKETSASEENSIKNENPKECDDEDVVASIMHYLLTQYSLQQGIKMFREKGEAATTKELKQMHDMEALIPLNVQSLTDEQKNKAMALLMFLTEKQDGAIKAWQCADGQK